MKDENIKRHTAAELRQMRERGETHSNLEAAKQISEEDLERLIAEDPDEAGIEWDWDNAVAIRAGEFDLAGHVVRFKDKYGDDYRAHLDKALDTYLQTH